MYRVIEFKGNWWFKLRNYFSRTMTSGYGQCYRCGGYWNVVKPHETIFRNVYGQRIELNPLCRTCWKKLERPVARLPFYRIEYDDMSWYLYDESGETWDRIKDAVFSDR